MDSKDAAFLKKLLATFKVEAGEHIAAISSGLIAMEKSPPTKVQADIIEMVFREAHSMKGAARSVNLTFVEAICQSLENVFAALKRTEIVPERELLDVLHQSVNVLGGLLSSVGELPPPPEKAGIRDLIRRLDSAAKRSTSKAESSEALLTSSSGEAAPQLEPSPAVPKVPADTMRISKQKLDSLLLKGEGLLSAKQAAAQRSAELHEITEAVATLKKDWKKIRPDLRAAEGATEKDGSGAVVSDTRVNRLLDFLESTGDYISKLHDSLGALGKAMEHDRRSVAAMVDDVLEDLKTVSMLPFSSLLEIMPKVVRDLSHDRGKEVELTFSGGAIEIDRRILDEMKDPLIHLVRNCIDHGIERPESRVANKKSPRGTIAIVIAYREGKSVEIIVSDDGAGIDTLKIRDTAVRLGLLSNEEAGEADEQKLVPFIFRSGVTTSPMITEISGRGLGLAIVQERVERLGGAVFCETSEGKGTVFRIILPLTLATFRGVLVRSDDRFFIIPITGLDRTVRVKSDEIKTVENKVIITIEGKAVPLVPLRTVLEFPRSEKDIVGLGSTQAAVLGTAEHRIAFVVDEVMREQEVLVKDLGRQLVRVRNVAGAAILGTGRVVPILNVADLLKSAVTVSSGSEAPSVVEARPAEKKSVLVVEDSITSRMLLKNILEAAGYDVQTAVDGIDAFTTLRGREFDIVVSDIDMPRMNGLDLTAKIRADKGLGKLPIVLVTALESREDRERGIDVGANAYIVKSSFDQSNLLEVIKRLI